MSIVVIGTGHFGLTTALYLAYGNRVICIDMKVGTSHSNSVREVVASVVRVSGREVPVRGYARRSDDPPMLVADTLQARQLLGCTPRIDQLDAIVGSAWDWHAAESSFSLAGRGGD